MKTFIFLFLSTVTLYAVAESSTQEKLIGVWGNSDDGGKTFWGFDQFFPDGTTKSWGEFPEDSMHYELEGAYLMHSSEPSVICFAVTKTSMPDIVPLGDYWCDQVITLTDMEFQYIDSSGGQYTLYKQYSN